MQRNFLIIGSSLRNEKTSLPRGEAKKKREQKKKKRKEKERKMKRGKQKIKKETHKRLIRMSRQPPAVLRIIRCHEAERNPEHCDSPDWQKFVEL
ncbi:hypothetical protein CEXT_454891 [Caerostris extrusa]|uniref:Uncharacterized protein n=1 Tax=Caerostris extrusa TaxID=172846 RepID=A0AAV4MXW4_CAEEX|nr:hypothetical protein CEXT_454891 [Caerostris extrusa]